MTDVRLNLALAALQTIAGCGLDAAGMARTAVVALAAIEGLEESPHVAEGSKIPTRTQAPHST